ncbi:hypothetical protein TRFO_14767 [Tritrichomonas foetus]|uniref:Leucine Rich Repeat family protein n=1 Tax=Tritrichomonas foetus TaxID=1144522 RepID=A0A1J4KUL0_9EUKA|nr:hypothetical protein TRFO_14767 [Tritrichomonas foetus]|eukprot:OHT14826.1 hypothetical protein TRFO_14767 [Tritrichomonas foetus]
MVRFDDDDKDNNQEPLSELESDSIEDAFMPSQRPVHFIFRTDIRYRKVTHNKGVVALSPHFIGLFTQSRSGGQLEVLEMIHISEVQMIAHRENEFVLVKTTESNLTCTGPPTTKFAQLLYRNYYFSFSMNSPDDIVEVRSDNLSRFPDITIHASPSQRFQFAYLAMSTANNLPYNHEVVRYLHNLLLSHNSIIDISQLPLDLASGTPLNARPEYSPAARIEKVRPSNHDDDDESDDDDEDEHKKEKGKKGEKHDKKGKKGEKGEKPQKGKKDEKSEKHAKGDKAEKSQKGEKAEKSSKGEKHGKGEKAEKGSKDEKAEKGSKGEKHGKGEKAEKGSKDEKAEKGSKGEKHAKGEKAEKGSKDEKAEKSQKGEKHAKGEKAEKSPKGEKEDKKGKKGDKSDKGEKPEKGEKGKKGKQKPEKGDKKKGKHKEDDSDNENDTDNENEENSNEKHGKKQKDQKVTQIDPSKHGNDLVPIFHSLNLMRFVSGICACNLFRPDLLSSFIPLVSLNDNLRIVHFENCGAISGLEDLSEAIHKCEKFSVSYWNLSYNKLENFESFASIIEYSQEPLLYLNLSYCDIENNASEKIFNALSENDNAWHLRFLLYAGNDMSGSEAQKGFESFMRTLSKHNSSLEYLDFGSITEGLTKILEILNKFQQPIKTLVLRGSTLDEEALKQLKILIHNSKTLSALDLSYMNLEPEVIAEIINQIGKNETLENFSLHLNGLNLNDENLLPLFREFLSRGLNKWKALSLDYNNMDENDLKNLIPLFMRMKNLQELSLNGNFDKTMEGIDDLLVKLLDIKRIETLSLAGSNEKHLEETLTSLLRKLARPDSNSKRSSILNLDISNNEIGDSLIPFINQILHRPETKLQKLNIDGNNLLSTDKLSTLVEAVDGCNSLVSFQFPIIDAQKITQHADADEKDVVIRTLSELQIGFIQAINSHRNKAKMPNDLPFPADEQIQKLVNEISRGMCKRFKLPDMKRHSLVCEELYVPLPFQKIGDIPREGGKIEDVEIDNMSVYNTPSMGEYVIEENTRYIELFTTFSTMNPDVRKLNNPNAFNNLLPPPQPFNPNNNGASSDSDTTDEPDTPSTSSSERIRKQKKNSRRYQSSSDSEETDDDDYRHRKSTRKRANNDSDSDENRRRSSRKVTKRGIDSDSDTDEDSDDFNRRKLQRKSQRNRNNTDSESDSDESPRNRKSTKKKISITLSKRKNHQDSSSDDESDSDEFNQRNSRRKNQSSKRILSQSRKNRNDDSSEDSSSSDDVRKPLRRNPPQKRNTRRDSDSDSNSDSDSDPGLKRRSRNIKISIKKSGRYSRNHNSDDSSTDENDNYKKNQKPKRRQNYDDSDSESNSDDSDIRNRNRNSRRLLKNPDLKRKGKPNPKMVPHRRRMSSSSSSEDVKLETKLYGSDEGLDRLVDANYVSSEVRVRNTGNANAFGGKNAPPLPNWKLRNSDSDDNGNSASRKRKSSRSTRK